MTDSFLARRERLFVRRHAWWLTVLIPCYVTARFVTETSFVLTGRPAVFWLTVVLTLAVGSLMRQTLVRWQSRALRAVLALWSLYGVGVLAVAILVTVRTIDSTPDAAAAFAHLAGAPVPLAHIAPAILVGPLTWAFVTDSFALGARRGRQQQLLGHVVLCVAMVAPLLVYYAGGWWGLNSTLPHVWHWDDFRAGVAALAVGCGTAVFVVAATRTWDSWHAHRLSQRLESEGWL